MKRLPFHQCQLVTDISRLIPLSCAGNSACPYKTNSPLRLCTIAGGLQALYDDWLIGHNVNQKQAWDTTLDGGQNANWVINKNNSDLHCITSDFDYETTD